MKRNLLPTLSVLLLMSGLPLQAHSQNDCGAPRFQEALNGNNVRAMILTGGDLR